MSSQINYYSSTFIFMLSRIKKVWESDYSADYAKLGQFCIRGS